jgi:hypothetical protein
MHVVKSMRDRERDDETGHNSLLSHSNSTPH